MTLTFDASSFPAPINPAFHHIADMEVTAVVRATAQSLRSSQRAVKSLAICPACRLRTITNSSRAFATPIAHPAVVAAPPPPPPQQVVSSSADRLERRKAQAQQLRQGQQASVNPSKPSSALQKRFWREVSVHEAPDGLQIHLDKRAVRTANRNVLSLPGHKRALAGAIALEWDQLVSAQQALKQHYVPLTSLTSRAIDIQAADAAQNSMIRENLVKMVMRYLTTDTLLCWAPEVDIHDPDNKSGRQNLRERQRAVAEPIIAYLKSHVFPGIDIEPILSEDSIVPLPQPKLTIEVIRGWVSGLPAFELAALERAVLATKSLLIALRLLVGWSREFQDVRSKIGDVHSFGIEQAAEASSLEVLHQTEQWGEVEDTHDVDAADVRRQLGSVVLLIC